MERSSRLQYNSMDTQEFEIFLKKFEINQIEFCPYPEFPYTDKRNCPGFVIISPIDSYMSN